MPTEALLSYRTSVFHQSRGKRCFYIYTSLCVLFEQWNYIRCPMNHFTHKFMACDGACWGGKDGDTSLCLARLTSLPPLFKCVDVQQSVPYTLVCDHRADCRDGSDEDFCYFPPCNITSPFRCDGKRVSTCQKVVTMLQ